MLHDFMLPNADELLADSQSNAVRADAEERHGNDMNMGRGAWAP